ncbi:AAA family ATPase [Enterovibrio norvegicus]|uniref:AAA family ATPase n=1 Tax=Enterovibrio norvegicus TaxID=188144 RepID=UPI00352CB264
MSIDVLDSITLNNFKCYERKEFDFSNLTVFCGNNSVGKSTAIQALLLAIQNEFSPELEFTGDFLQLGSYSDIHKKDAEKDGMSISIKTSKGLVTWGYLEDEFNSDMRAQIEEAPLPLLKEHTQEEARSWLKERYSSGFTFLSAERWGPRSNYPYSTQRRSPDWLGTHGEYAPQVLHRNKNFQLEPGDVRIHEGTKFPHLTTNLHAWMSEISPGINIEPTTYKDADMATNQFEFGEHTLRPTNVGFGLSYTLPVVLSLLLAKSGGLVVIENPEAHLHPKGQSYLGRLIQKTAEAGVQVIIETHSDHILNGIRVAARLSESYVDGSAKIFFISSGELQSDVEELPIDTEGEIPFWPDGFFDQQALDIKSIILGRNITEMPKRVSRER